MTTAPVSCLLSVIGHVRQLPAGSLDALDDLGCAAYGTAEARAGLATALVRGLFDKVDVPSVLGLYSGYAHGHPFALWREHAEEVVGDALCYRPLVNEDSFKGAVTIASYALYPPGERLSKLFGLDDAGGLTPASE